jgi:hypothetical protein
MQTFAEKTKASQKAAPANCSKPRRASVTESDDVKSILHLQQTMGNRAVRASLQSGHNFGRIPVSPPPRAAAIQTKLAVNKPGDEYEQEADSVASKVMSMPEPQLQRACACGGACPECRNHKDGEEQIQTKPVPRIAVGEGAVRPPVEEVLSSSGQPLDSATRAFFEPRFGQDFSQVRLHSDTPAAESAQALGAQAYTVGSHIVFGEKAGAPATQASLQLLAHELTHVVQQGTHHSVIQRQMLPPGSANPRFDTYSVTGADLSNPDIVARFKFLPLSRLIQYRNRITDADVIAYIDRLLADRLNALTFDQLFAYFASEKDPAVRSYIDQWLTTHAPTSYEIALGATKPGETKTEMKASGISVKVLPDEYVDEAAFKSITDNVSSGQVTTHTGAITVYTPKWHPRWHAAGGRVTSIEPTIQELKIKTVYLRGISRIAQSAYGVGTREEDVKRGRTSIAHHEGSHAACFIQFVKSNAPPTFTGRVDDTETQVKNKAQAFDAAMKEYYASMVNTCGPSVDCTGKKAPFCP